MERQEERVSVQQVAAAQQDEIVMEECRRLWEESFDETKKYTDYYFENKWKRSLTLLLSGSAGDVYSMLHLNPYRVMVQEKEYLLHYIVGVCTKLEKRRRGYMKKIIQEMFGCLYDRQEPFTFLMPARSGLYEPFGFRFFYEKSVIKRTLHPTENAGKIDVRQHGGIYFADFEDASTEDRDKMISVAQRLLSSQYQIYVSRTLDYYEEMSRELQACGGQLLLLYREGHLVGYLGYGWEEKEIFISELLGMFLQEDVLSSFGDYICEKVGEKGILCALEDTAFVHQNGENKPVIMGRIIYFPACAALLRSQEPEVLRIYIHDSWIEENEGVWKLDMDQENCRVTKESLESKWDREITIEEFQEEFFGSRPSYLNEMT